LELCDYYEDMTLPVDQSNYVLEDISYTAKQVFLAMYCIIMPLAFLGNNYLSAVWVVD
jgi:hypothetical protein